MTTTNAQADEKYGFTVEGLDEETYKVLKR
jgi:hypothetical protein